MSFVYKHSDIFRPVPMLSYENRNELLKQLNIFDPREYNFIALYLFGINFYL